MTFGKKIVVAFAIVLPLVLVGSGIAMAAGGIPGLTQGAKDSAAPYQVSPLSERGPGYCNYGDCPGPCDDGEFDGECPRLTAGASNFPAWGRCGGRGAAKSISSSCIGAACWQASEPTQDPGAVCASCDVAGLNEYPPNSPKYVPGT
jgi:hypothetical protein